MQAEGTSHTLYARDVLAPMSETDRSIAEVTNVEVLEACQMFDWHLGDAAKQLRVTRTALKDRIERTPDLLIAMQDADEAMIDDAEKVIKVDLKANDSTTARMVAQTKGKNRGWGTAGVNKDGAIIVEVRTFPDPAVGGSDGSKG